MTKPTLNDLSGLATEASRGLTALSGLDTSSEPSVGVAAGIRLCSVLTMAARDKDQVQIDPHREDDPEVQFAVGAVARELPGTVMAKLAHEAASAEQDLAKLESDDQSVGEDRVQELAEVFAKIAIVLRDYAL